MVGLVALTRPSGDTVATPGELSIGGPAPDLRLVDLDGRPFELASLRGRPVVLNFWASWCVPCREEFPLLEQALAAHASEDLAVVGVLFKDDVAPARAFMEQMGVRWVSVQDPDDVAAGVYRVVAPPTTFFIARDGTVMARQIGELRAEDLERQLAAILR